jgi:hypothetical protein
MAVMPSALNAYHADADITLSIANTETLKKHGVAPGENMLYFHIAAKNPHRKSKKFIEESLYQFDPHELRATLLFQAPTPAPCMQ